MLGCCRLMWFSVFSVCFFFFFICFLLSLFELVFFFCLLPPLIYLKVQMHSGTIYHHCHMNHMNAINSNIGEKNNNRILACCKNVSINLSATFYYSVNILRTHHISIKIYIRQHIPSPSFHFIDQSLIFLLILGQPIAVSIITLSFLLLGGIFVTLFP